MLNNQENAMKNGKSNLTASSFCQWVNECHLLWNHLCLDIHKEILSRMLVNGFMQLYFMWKYTFQENDDQVKYWGKKRWSFFDQKAKVLVWWFQISLIYTMTFTALTWGIWKSKDLDSKYFKKEKTKIEHYKAKCVLTTS